MINITNKIIRYSEKRFWLVSNSFEQTINFAFGLTSSGVIEMSLQAWFSIENETYSDREYVILQTLTTQLQWVFNDF
jgi:hypothetical protein